MEDSDLNPKLRFNPQDTCIHQNHYTGQQCRNKALLNGKCHHHSKRAIKKMEEHAYNLGKATFMGLLDDPEDFTLKSDIANTALLIKKLEEGLISGSIEHARMTAPQLASQRNLKRQLIESHEKSLRDRGATQPLSFTVDLLSTYREFVAEGLLAAGVSIDILAGIDEKMMYVIKAKLEQAKE